MRSDTGRTESVWMTTVAPRVLPRLTEDLRADVAVIGAGIAGMTTAYLLAV
jgi:ribulose 1,5-bisphosphate synthetase/thiazole synthase